MKKKIHISSLKAEDKNDTRYWLGKSAAERFEALEILRQRFFGYDETTQRFQRTIEYLQR